MVPPIVCGPSTLAGRDQGRRGHCWASTVQVGLRDALSLLRMRGMVGCRGVLVEFGDIF